MKSVRTVVSIGLLLAACALSACGGGGGGGSAEVPAPTSTPDSAVKQWDQMKWDEGQWQ